MWPVWLEPRQRGREGQVRVNSSVLVLGSPLQRRELEDPWRNGRPSIRSRNHQGLCPEFPSVMSAHSGPSRDLERLPGAPCMPRQPWAGPRLCYSPPLSSCHPRSQICHFLGSPGHSPSFRVGHCPRRVHLCPALHPQGPPAGLSSVGGTGLHQAPGAEPESGPQPSPAQPLSPTPAPALPSACAGSPTASRCWPPGAPRCPPPPPQRHGTWDAFCLFTLEESRSGFPRQEGAPSADGRSSPGGIIPPTGWKLAHVLQTQ